MTSLARLWLAGVSHKYRDERARGRQEAGTLDRLAHELSRKCRCAWVGGRSSAEPRSVRDVARDLSLLTCLLTYLPAYLAQRLAHILAREVDGGGLLALLEEALAWVGARWVAEVCGGGGWQVRISRAL